MAAKTSTVSKNETVLLVDDDENDALLMQTAFQRAHFHPSLTVLTDGEQAIEYLKGDGEYGNRNLHPWPCVMVLDLKMPKTNGFEVLQWAKDQRDLPHFPIIVMSSSSLQEDVQKAMSLGADSYIVKSSDYLQAAKTIGERCL